MKKVRLAFLLPLIPVVVIAIGWYGVHTQSTSVVTALVTAGPITQEVFASGNTEASTTAHMRFTQSGTLTALNVITGETVHKGDLLARLNDRTAIANYNEAAASLTSARATLHKLLAGASASDVRVATSAQTAAAVAVAGAAHTLTQTLASINTDLGTVLGSQVDQLFTQPQAANPGFGISIQSGPTTYRITTTATEQTVIADLRTQVASDLAALQMALHNGDAPIVQTQKADDALNDMASLLNHIAAVVNTYIPADTTAKTVYQSYQTSIASARATVATNQQTLAAAVVAYQNAEAGLNSADATVAHVTAPARQQDITAAQAAVAAAAAKQDAAAAALDNLRLVAPTDGTVTDTEGVVGEVVDPNTAVVSVMPHSILDIKAHVSEDAILGVRVGDRARIELDAFPAGTSFTGTVTKIDPAQTIIGGAVYYMTTIQFATSSPLIRPGMTTNVWIETGHASDTLQVPASALQHTNTATYVSVLHGKTRDHRRVTTGLTAQNGMVEIRSGLRAGDRVVLGQ